MIAIVTWLWPGPRGYCPAHANVLLAMLRRTMTVPFRLVAISDETEGFAPGVEVIRTPPAAAALAGLETPEGAHRYPSCYRRLWMFSPEARALGQRVLLTDVDVVVTGDLAPLLTFDDFVGWLPAQPWGLQGRRLAGGMYLLRTGTRTAVWDGFAGQESIKAARKAGWRGSDQAWISHCLAATAPVWPPEAGICTIRDLTGRDRATRSKGPPRGARIIHMKGGNKPWDAATVAQHPWIAEHWRE